jgi:hypothetical protein
MDYASQIAFAVLLAIPVACVAWTITQEELFREVQEGLRAYQREHPDSFWRQKLAYLPTCPYCLSHYVAAVFIALFRFRMLADDWRGYVVSLFALVLLANVYITLYNLLRVVLRAAKAAADRAQAILEAKHPPPTAESARAKSWPARTAAQVTGRGSRSRGHGQWARPAGRQGLVGGRNGGFDGQTLRDPNGRL